MNRSLCDNSNGGSDRSSITAILTSLLRSLEINSTLLKATEMSLLRLGLGLGSGSGSGSGSVLVFSECSSRSKKKLAGRCYSCFSSRHWGSHDERVTATLPLGCVVRYTRFLYQPATHGSAGSGSIRGQQWLSFYGGFSKNKHEHRRTLPALWLVNKCLSRQHLRANPRMHLCVMCISRRGCLSDGERPQNGLVRCGRCQKGE